MKAVERKSSFGWFPINMLSWSKSFSVCSIENCFDNGSRYTAKAIVKVLREIVAGTSWDLRVANDGPDKELSRVIMRQAKSFDLLSLSRLINWGSPKVELS